MQIKDSVVLVTGANRGIGAEFVRQLAERGAAKIYATARDASTITADGVEAVALDVTDAERVQAVAAFATDVDIVINNAGVSLGADVLGGDLDTVRREFETNVFGPLNVTRAFAPILGANGGGAILNVISALSWFAAEGSTSYSMSKAAAWSLTEGTRVELAGQGTQVVGLHMALVDTDMTAGFDAPKSTPAAIVTAALDGLEAGALEVLGDDVTVGVKAQLHLDPAERYALLAG
ncbi:short-subunit dehydrogenase [Labedella gwakjiensis]|uniref:SDR family NAD(P)-dependent oxidoreductase n=1 Tax=Labedella gwakjiensis TaxID=390269 RepID=A0A2P8GVB0_9MICO|nr:SDR family oxidoreductase [Labedella gwakjiensis]PSL37904.1 short-subunit dehydrogenase [Labedella gwakjiensis]RUQ87527.1 SDR family NAD(P)-dependent oxidoreductase [Labedella gwakjiensis]